MRSQTTIPNQTFRSRLRSRINNLLLAAALLADFFVVLWFVRYASGQATPEEVAGIVLALTLTIAAIVVPRINHSRRGRTSRIVLIVAALVLVPLFLLAIWVALSLASLEYSL